MGKAASSGRGRLAGRVTRVGGAGAGLWRAIAAELAREGARLVSGPPGLLSASPHAWP